MAWCKARENNKEGKRVRDKESELNWMSNWSRSIDAQSVLTTLIRAHNAVKKKASIDNHPMVCLVILFWQCKKKTQKKRRTVYQLIWLQSHCIITFSNWVQSQSPSNGIHTIHHPWVSLSLSLLKRYLISSIAIISFLFC